MLEVNWSLGAFEDRRLDKGGAILLERMVGRGEVCLRRLGAGRRPDEVRFGRFLANDKVTLERLIEGWAGPTAAAVAGRHLLAIPDTPELSFKTSARSERRRVGKECRSPWSPYHLKKRNDGVQGTK